jgi:hypothetical protein
MLFKLTHYRPLRLEVEAQAEFSFARGAGREDAWYRARFVLYYQQEGSLG